MDGGGANLGSARGDVFIGVDQAIRNLKNLSGELTGLGRTAGGIGPQFTGIGLAAGVAGGAVLAGIGDAIGTAMTFEKQMSAVGAAIGADALPMMDALSEKALQIGADTSFGANQAGMAMEELAKAGVSADDILGGVADSTVHLAEAVGADLPTAAGLMTASMNIFGRGADQAADSADTITAAINESSASVPDFLGGMRNLGPVAANMGVSFEETAAAIAYFTNFGLKGADAGVSLARGLTMAAAPTDEARAKMDQLGLSVFDLEGKFVGFPSLFEQLQTQMGGLSDQEREAALSMIFGAEAADVMSIAIKNGADSYNELTGAVQPANQAADTAATRLDNLAGDAEKLSGAIETVKIRIGQGFTPALRIAAQAATLVVDAFSALPVPLQQMAGYAVAAGGGLLTLASASILSAGRVGMMVAQLRQLNFGMALVPPQVRLAVAAIAGIGLAYKTNFLGTRDLVDDAVDRVQEFGEDFGDVFDRLRKGSRGGYFDHTTGQFVETGEGASVASSGIRAFGSALEDLTGVENSAFFGGLADGADTALAAIDRLQFHFDNLRRGGLNPVLAGLGAVSATLRSMFGDNDVALAVADAFELALVSVDAFLDDLSAAGGKFADGIADLVRAAFSGDLFSEVGLDAGRKILAGLGDAVSAAPKALGRFLKGVKTGIGPLDRILNRGGRAVESFGRLVQELGQGDMTGAIATGGRMLRQLGETAAIVGEEGGFAFREMGRGIVGLADTFPMFRGELEGIGEGVQGFGDVFEGVFTGDWQQALDGAGDMLAGFGSAAIAGLATIGDGAVAAFQAIPWGTIGSAVRDAAVAAFQAIPWGDVWETIEGLLGAAAAAGVQIGEVAVDIANWAWGEVKDLGSWLTGAVREVTGDGTGGLGMESVRARIESVLVDVLDWAKGTAWPSLRDFVTTEAEAAAGVIAGYAVQIGDVLVDIGRWAQGEAWPSLREFVATQTMNAWGIISGIGVSIGKVLVDAAGWAKGVWPGIREFVVTQTMNAWAIVSGIAVNLGTILLDLVGWAKGVWPSLREFVVTKTMDAWAIISDIAVPLEALKVEITAFLVDVDWVELGTSIRDNWFSNREGVGAEADALGQEMGAYLAEQLLGGFAGSGDDGGGGLGAAIGAGVVAAGAASLSEGNVLGPVGVFINGFIDGVIGEIQVQLAEEWEAAIGELGGFLDTLASPFEAIGDWISGLFSTGMVAGRPETMDPNYEGFSFKTLLDDLVQPLVDWVMPNIDNPFSGLGGTIQGWVDGIKMPSVPEWVRRLANGDLLGAIQALSGGGGGGTEPITTADIEGGAGFWDPTMEPVDIDVPVQLHPITESGGVDQATMDALVAENIARVEAGLPPIPMQIFLDPDYEPVAGSTEIDPAKLEPTIGGNGLVVVEVPLEVQYARVSTGVSQQLLGVDTGPTSPPAMVIPPADTTAFKSSVDTAVGDAVNKLATVDDIPAKAIFLADASDVALKFTDVSVWGDTWDQQRPSADFLADHGDAAIKYTDVMTWGDLWEQFVGTGSFDGDDSNAQAAADAAFDSGNDWDGTVFTASFDVDTTGLTDALAVARGVAAEIAAIMPNSPAKKGPLRKVPSFKYIADAAERDLGGIGDTISRSLGFEQMARFGAAGGFLAGSGVPPAGGGSTVINRNTTIITLPSEEWVRTSRDAEIGAAYAYASADEAILGGAE